MENNFAHVHDPFNFLNTEDPRYNDSVCDRRFCCKIEFAVVKKLDRTQLKHQ